MGSDPSKIKILNSAKVDRSDRSKRPHESEPSEMNIKFDNFSDFSISRAVASKILHKKIKNYIKLYSLPLIYILYRVLYIALFWDCMCAVLCLSIWYICGYVSSRPCDVLRASYLANINYIGNIKLTGRNQFFETLIRSNP